MTINNIVLIGRITRDPDLRQSPNGTSRATFTLAVESFIKEQEG